MKVIANRVCVSSSTVGTGNLSLGAARDGFQNFTQAGIQSGAQVSYVIEEGNKWEIGTGTFTSPSTLTRTVLDSSNSDAPIDLNGAGTVYLSLNSSDLDSIITKENIWDSSQIVALTDANVIAVDMASFVNASVTLGANRTLANPTNALPGKSGFIRIVQDATGSRTLDFQSNWKVQGDIELSTTPGAEDILCYLVIDATNIILKPLNPSLQIDDITGLETILDSKFDTENMWDSATLVTLTDATSIAVDLDSGINYSVTLAGNRTLANPTNAVPGQNGFIRVVQDATGSRTLSFGSNWKVQGTIQLSTTAGAEDILCYLVLDATNIILKPMNQVLEVGDVSGLQTILNTKLESSNLWDSSAIVTLTDATSIAVNLTTGINYTVTLGGNRTLANPTGAIVGKSGFIRVVQDATGSRTLTLGSNWNSSGLNLQTTPNAVDLLGYLVVSSTNIVLKHLNAPINISDVNGLQASLDSKLTTSNLWNIAGLTAITDAATITLDFATFLNGSVILAGNRTLANPTNPVVGKSGFIRVTQDGTGSRTLAYGTNWKFPGGTAPVLSTVAGAVDILCYMVVSPTFIVINMLGDVK